MVLDPLYLFPSHFATSQSGTAGGALGGQLSIVPSHPLWPVSPLQYHFQLAVTSEWVPDGRKRSQGLETRRVSIPCHPMFPMHVDCWPFLVSEMMTAVDVVSLFDRLV